MPPALGSAARLAIGYRPATDADLPFLSLVYASTRTEELAVTGWPAATQQSFLAQQFDAQHRYYRAHYPDAEWLVIEQAGRAVGRLYIEQRSGDLRVIDLALLPDARGRGIGGAILDDLIAEARSGGSSVSVHVEKTNRAIQLYRRLGFVRVDQSDVYDLMERRPETIGVS